MPVMGDGTVVLWKSASGQRRKWIHEEVLGYHVNDHRTTEDGSVNEALPLDTLDVSFGVCLAPFAQSP
jgi:hypothetical protein